MNPFHSISVTLGLVIGLGVARILSAFVSVFRSRTQASIDWIPLVWAACIFLWQIQFWWAIIELPSHLSTWTLTEFFLLLSMTLLLYVSAALVLPATDIIHGRTLADTFQRDGKWALLFLSAYFGQAIIVNWYLFDAPPFRVSSRSKHPTAYHPARLPLRIFTPHCYLAHPCLSGCRAMGCLGNIPPFIYSPLRQDATRDSVSRESDRLIKY